VPFFSYFSRPILKDDDLAIKISED